MIEEMKGDFLQWLRGFYSVVETGTVTGGASLISRNQSTVTNQIKALERQLGVSLFDRSGGKLTLTPEGKTVFDTAVSLFELIREMSTSIRAGESELEGRIRIAATHVVNLMYLPKIIVNFMHQHPKVSFDLEGWPLGMIVEKVEAAEVDLGIATVPVYRPKIVTYNLFESKVRLIAPKKNRFLKNARPTLEQISEAPFVSFLPSATLTPYIEKVFQERNLNLNVVIVLNNFEMIKTYVALGLGVSIVYDFMIVEGDENRFNIFALDRFFPPRWHGLIIRRKKYLSPAVRQFIQTLKLNPEIVR